MFGEPLQQKCYTSAYDSIDILFKNNGTEKKYEIICRPNGIYLQEKQVHRGDYMRAIRFIEEGSSQHIHRYIVGYSDEMMDAVWKAMFAEDGDHCFYENPKTGLIELPKIGIPYSEIPVRDALYFEVHEPGWEKIEWNRRERRTKIPKVGHIIAKYPMEMPIKNAVVFKAKQE